KLAPVDEDRWRPLQAELLRLFPVGGHRISDCFALAVGVETLQIQTELLGEFHETRIVKLRLVGKKRLVHLPELPLFAGGYGRPGSAFSMLVHRQGKVLEGEAYLFRKFLDRRVD